jgi:hypothetical protein
MAGVELSGDPLFSCFQEYEIGLVVGFQRSYW